MPFDLQALIAERRSEKFELFERHLNAPLVRVLRVLGYDADRIAGLRGAGVLGGGKP